MGNQQSLKEMKHLVSILNIASDKYHNDGTEIMSNKEFDEKYDRLLVLEAETGITISNSPTQSVGYEVRSNLPKMKHEYPAKSLDKTKDINKMRSWIKDQVGLLSWKLDGLTVVVTYENGELVHAVTRGNGEIGDEITANAKTFINLPLKISYPFKLTVRGEAVISYENFEKINAGIEKEEDKYKNPRNLVAGTVRQLDSAVCASRNVEFVAFEVVGSMNMVDRKEDKLWALEQRGFDVVEHIATTEENMEDVLKYFDEKSKEYKYPVDGLVLTYNSQEYSDSLGETSKFPLHSIAFKWADETEETALIDVEWSASRTGLINPVAVFKPVDLEGTTVERASLFNVDIFEELQLGKGDTITVYKANKIIPQVDENLTRSATLVPPTECPVCGGSAVIKIGKTARFLHCENELCGAKIVKRLAHFASRNAMNIDGLSEATLEKFVDAGIVSDIPDIYGLTKHKATICKMDGMGLKSYNKLITAIEKSKTVNMANFIYALGIPNVGVSTAKDLVKAFDNDFEDFTHATKNRLMSVDGIGGIVADSIYGFIREEKNDKLMYVLFSIMTFEQPQEVNADSAIAGKTFVITGDVNIFKNRKEVQAKIESLGGKVSGSVSKSTDYLFNNDSESSSSKNKKAKDLGVPIITEQQFIEMIGE